MTVPPLLTNRSQLLKCYSVICLLAVVHISATGQIKRSSDSVAVTRLSIERKIKKVSPLKKGRLQFMATDSALSLRSSHTSSLPKKVKRIEFIQSSPNGRLERVQFKRSQIKEIMTREQMKIFERDSLHGAEKISRTKYLKEVEKFMAGRYSGLRLMNQWITLAELPANGDVEVSAKFKIGWFKTATLSATKLPQHLPVGYPAVDVTPCQPFNRFYERRKLLGYGLDRIRYKPFHISNRKITRRNFTVYFQKNSSEAEAESYQQIVDYVKQNDLSVVEVSVEAFASVEGDSLNNYGLQRRRAQRIVKLLQKKNNEYIHLDTVIVSEAWEEFRNAIRGSPFKGLDTLNNQQLRSLLTADENLLEQLEPILKPQRRATMKIVTARKLSQEEMIDAIRKKLEELGMKLLPHLNRSRDFSETEAHVLGVFQYFDKLIADGKATFSDLAILVDSNPASNQLKVLLFYHFIKKIEQKEFENDGEPLDSVFSKRKWNNLFHVANSSIITLVASDPPQLRHNRIRQAVDIQYYTTKYIEEGILDPQILCTFDYPHHPLFYGLKLQHYALLYSLSESHELVCFQHGASQTETLQVKSFNESDLTEFIDTRKSDSTFATREEPSFDTTPKGDYYYFIKTLLVSGDKSVQDFVNTSDNMIEFDLLHLLRLNVDGWNPITNHYYDSAIQFVQMEKLVRKLRSMDRRICDQVVNQLYLDFYYKALLHIEHYFQPGDRVFVNIADESLKYISEYYGARSGLVFPKLAVYVGDALNSYYWIPSRSPSTFYAYKFLKSLEQRIPPDGPLFERWKKYQAAYGK